MIQNTYRDGYIIKRPLQLIAALEVGGVIQKEQEDQGGSTLNPTAEERWTF